MVSPLGADDSPHGALSPQERAALSTWADEGDPSDGFTDKVLMAWLAEHHEGLSSIEGEAEAHEVASKGPEPRTTVGRARLRRMVGWGTAIAAAAVVMLMVRVLPRASQVEHAQSLACDPTEGSRAEGSRAIVGVQPRAAPTAPEPEATILGAQAADVLAHHCSPCHDSTDPEGKAGALEVFDLEEPYWWPTMSDAQLEDARGRVRDLQAATDDERQRVDAFVDAELRRRARAG